MKVSDITDFDICLSKEAVKKKQRNRTQTIRFLVTFIVFSFILSLIVPNQDASGGGLTFLSLLGAVSIFLVRGAVLALIILGVMYLNGFRARYDTMEALDPLDDENHRRIAYKLSKKLAEKKAAKTGRDLVWSESRFKEGMEEDAWAIE